MCKLDTAINTTGGTAIACGGGLSIDYFTHFLSDNASLVGIVGLLLSVALNFYFNNKKIKLEEKKQADDYALKKALIENKRADNLELMSDYYNRKDKHFREKMDKLDKLDMIDKLDNSDIKEFIKDLVNEHFKNLDDGK